MSRIGPGESSAWQGSASIASRLTPAWWAAWMIRTPTSRVRMHRARPLCASLAITTDDWLNPIASGPPPVLHRAPAFHRCPPPAASRWHACHSCAASQLRLLLTGNGHRCLTTTPPPPPPQTDEARALGADEARYPWYQQ